MSPEVQRHAGVAAGVVPQQSVEVGAVAPPGVFPIDLVGSLRQLPETVGEGLEDGSFASSNGLEFNGGPSGDDADYWYVETGLTF